MRHRMLSLASVAVVGLAVAGAATLTPSAPVCAQQKPVSYAEDVAPIFRGYCASCHRPGGEGYKASGFDVSSHDSVMAGTKFGRMVIPGQPDASNLVVLIEGRASPKIQMPYKHHPLPSCLRQTIWTWVFQGAKNN